MRVKLTDERVFTMKLRSRILLSVLAGLTSVGCIVLDPADATVMDKEKALIIWNPKTKVEHFVRAASFTGAKGDFAFIVPTPTVPQVEVTNPTFNSEVFASLDYLSWRTKQPGPIPGGMPVVIQTKRVGSYDSYTVKADNVRSLDKWLQDHNFKRTPDFDNWAKFYIDKKWVFTAFKLTPNAKVAELEPIHLTFDTLEPFFPYREPAGGPHSESRSFKLFFMALDDYVPVIDRGPWKPESVLHVPDHQSLLPRIERDLNLGDGYLKGYKLTTYIDRSISRGNSGDITFVPAPLSGSVPPPVAYTFAGVLLGGALVFVAVRVFRRA